jgi:hypothetical protein
VKETIEKLAPVVSFKVCLLVARGLSIAFLSNRDRLVIFPQSPSLLLEKHIKIPEKGSQESSRDNHKRPKDSSSPFLLLWDRFVFDNKKPIEKMQQ